MLELSTTANFGVEIISINKIGETKEKI